MQSIFAQKSKKPTNEELKKALGNTFDMWETLVQYTFEVYPTAIEEWKFTSEKFGWSYRISDKKRVIIYLLPRDNFFKVAFVLNRTSVFYVFFFTSNAGAVFINVLLPYAKAIEQDSR